jgi:hypothetical protein
MTRSLLGSALPTLAGRCRISAEAIEKAELVVGMKRRGPADDRAQAGEIEPVGDRRRNLQQAPDHGRHQVGGGDAVPVHQLQELLGVEARLQDAGAAQDEGDAGKEKGSRVVEGAADQVHLVRVQPQARDQRKEVFRQPRFIYRIENPGRSLGPAGGARGVDHGLRRVFRRRQGVEIERGRIEEEAFVVDGAGRRFGAEADESPGQQPGVSVPIG